MPVAAGSVTTEPTQIGGCERSRAVPGFQGPPGAQPANEALLEAAPAYRESPEVIHDGKPPDYDISLTLITNETAQSLVTYYVSGVGPSRRCRRPARR